jgi:hypothetical protein
MSTMALPVPACAAIPWVAAAGSSAAVSATSRLIGEAEFAAVYAAADFAAEFEMWMDTSVTISWSLLGVTGDDAVQAAFTGFTKCLRDWLIRRANPVAFVFAHEVGPVVGLRCAPSRRIPSLGPRLERPRRWSACPPRCPRRRTPRRRAVAALATLRLSDEGL